MIPSTVSHLKPPTADLAWFSSRDAALRRSEPKPARLVLSRIDPSQPIDGQLVGPGSGRSEASSAGRFAPASVIQTA